MKTQLFPYYLRKPGLVLFALASLPSVVAGFTDGFYREEHQLLSKQTMHLLDIIGIVGLAVYALSKEKVYDELLQRLRLEAIKLTFIASLAIIALGYGVFPDFKVEPSYLINLQVLCFIGVYSFKKNNIVSAVG